MAAKQNPAKFRYAPEDLARRDAVADAAGVDSFIMHNKASLDASIERAHVEHCRGESVTIDQAMADLRRQQARRRALKT